VIEVRRVLGAAFLVFRPSQALRRFGVPVGGPFDLPLAEAAGGDAWIEFTGRIELTGEGTVSAAGTDRDGIVAPGVFHSRRYRAYLAVGSTIEDAPQVRTTRRIVQGDRFPSIHAVPQPVPELPREASWLSGPFAHLLLESTASVSPWSDRRGVRLDGIGAPHDARLPSRPVVVGAIQVTPDGTAIVIGPDGPTIGGYPVAGYVTEASLPLIAQTPPGELVRFVRATWEEDAD
jgi:hypothetical protein